MIFYPGSHGLAGSAGIGWVWAGLFVGVRQRAAGLGFMRDLLGRKYLSGIGRTPGTHSWALLETTVCTSPWDASEPKPQASAASAFLDAPATAALELTRAVAGFAKRFPDRDDVGRSWGIFRTKHSESLQDGWRPVMMTLHRDLSLRDSESKVSMKKGD